jgi:hypothetical protein
MTAPTTEEIRAELFSTTCRCGREKEARKSFCFPCYMRLPRYLRTALYKRLGAGYEEMYQSALKLLFVVE